MPTIGPTNVELAEALEQMAEVLVRRGETNPYRVQAYLQAAGTIREQRDPVARLFGEGGTEALMTLPGVGVSLARHIGQYIETGRIALRDRLLRADDPATLLATVPGVSERLARRLVEDLGVTSLADLERAAHDGRLRDVDGLGPRRVEAIRLQLNSILNRSSRRRARRVRRQMVQLAAVQPADEPSRDSTTPRDDTAAHADLASDARPTATIYPLFPPAAA